MALVETVQTKVVEPEVGRAAAEAARLVNAARAELLHSETSVTVEMMADSLGKDPDTVRRWIARQRKAHRLVTVTHDGRVYVPTVQLDDAFGLHDRVADIVGRLVEAGMDGWAVWHWFETPNPWLDGEHPSEAVERGALDAVAHAAGGLFQE